MSQEPTTNLPEGTYGSFTRTCQCGATIHVIHTVEQPHEHSAVLVNTGLDTVHRTDLGETLRSVIDLGEDFELWFVTGTSDGHSAEEAVREYWGKVLGPVDLADMLTDYGLGALGLEYRTDWAWKHPAGWPPEREPEDDSRLVSGDEGEGLPRFSGYLVQL